MLELLGATSASGATVRAAEGATGDDEGLVHLERLPARTAETVPLPDDLPAALTARLSHAGIDALYTHQAEALERARAGEHLVVATGTASGKSLCYQLPIAESLLADARTTALYLAPTKALARDQLRAVRGWRLPQIRAAAIDGDTPREERDAIRRTANWLLTNPDLLHHSLLPGHRGWADFLHRLGWIVVDEAHTARGVFGGHVALVLRRLRRLAERYGAAPTVLAASATIGNPAEHATALTGLPVAAIERDGSPRGPMDLALWQPPFVEDREEATADPSEVATSDGPAGDGPGSADGPPSDAVDEGDVPVAASGQARRSMLRETGDLLASFVAAGVQTLVFTKSRKGAEVVALVAGERLGDATDDEGRRLADAVAAYRAGYLADDRRRLETDLREGRLRGVAATQALELGIDVAGLDAALLAGWPGTTAALWQRLGRAGRRGEASVGMLVAQQDPLDHYLVTHPEQLLTRPAEDAIVDPANPYLLGPHLRCACQEQPLDTVEAAERFGATAPGLLAADAAAGVLRERGGRYHWPGRRRAAGQVDLRSAGGQTVRIVDTESGALIGDVDEDRAHRTVHPGARYLHQGRAYDVIDLDLDRAMALCEPATRRGITTRPRVDTDVAMLERLAQGAWGEVELGLSKVEVTTQVTGYDVLAVGSGEVLDRVELALPPQHLRTVAVWYALDEERLWDAGVARSRVPGALHAAEHAAIGMLPLLALCDRWDLGGLSTARHPETDRATVFVYDGHPGGAGLAERSFHRLAEHLALTRTTIAECGCRDGCPSCVQSPKCGNGNDPLDKAGAVVLLDLLADQRGDERPAGPATQAG